MAKFKCKSTGQVYEFMMEHDIKSMTSHPEYELVIEEELEVKAPAVKKAGRPSKASVSLEEVEE